MIIYVKCFLAIADDSFETSEGRSINFLFGRFLVVTSSGEIMRITWNPRNVAPVAIYRRGVCGDITRELARQAVKKYLKTRRKVLE